MSGDDRRGVCCVDCLLSCFSCSEGYQVLLRLVRSYSIPTVGREGMKPQSPGRVPAARRATVDAVSNSGQVARIMPTRSVSPLSP